MDGWMDGRMDGRIEKGRQIDRKTDRQKERQTRHACRQTEWNSIHRNKKNKMMLSHTTQHSLIKSYLSLVIISYYVLIYTSSVNCLLLSVRKEETDASKEAAAIHSGMSDDAMSRETHQCNKPLLKENQHTERGNVTR